MTATSKQESVAEGTNVKETIESILVAFILAFIFRAFVVEAFVIPTGSMAPTLLGAHMHFTCPDCGYQFDVNYTSPDDRGGDDPHIDSEGLPRADVYCPNCGELVASARRASDQSLVPVLYGDRILVMKYVYLLHDPKRWDVVVFKSPDSPSETHYTQNFIKRLVGKPGEELMVLDGHIFISSDKGQSWQIQARPAQVQEALWRIIYDNDFYPHLQRDPGVGPVWKQPWMQDAGSGWNLGTDYTNGRTFHFDNSSSGGEIRFDPTANTTTQTTTDYLVYDVGSELRRADRPDDDSRANQVADLKLALYYHRTSGDGPLRVKLVRHEENDHTFYAEITGDSIRLMHSTEMNRQQVSLTQIGDTKKLSDLGLKADEPMFIELLSADYQITLRVNGKQILQSTRADFAPDITWLRDQFAKNNRNIRAGEAAVEAQSQTCTLDHIGLWKSIYYTNRDDSYRVGTPNNPVVLGPEEYFTMGDNSAVSKDARVWTDPIYLPHEGLDVEAGRVPGQFLLGQAIFVYWPAGYRPFNSSLSIIPDFGDMRWIH